MKTLTLATLALTLITTLWITTLWTLGPLHSTEPSYHGKKLTRWLADLDSLDPEVCRHGAEAVRALGTNALPTLAKRLRTKDSRIRRRLIELCESYPIVVLVPAEAHYESALEACRILGPMAGPLTLEIIGFLADNRRTKAVKVLAAVGDCAIQPLEMALASPDEQVRAGAAAALGSIARQPQTSVAALMELLNDSSDETRMAAAWALGRFGGEANSAAASLSALTNDSAYNVREQAKVALTRIASDAQRLAGAPR